jgi:hypothetical protein
VRSEFPHAAQIFAQKIAILGAQRRNFRYPLHRTDGPIHFTRIENPAIPLRLELPDLAMSHVEPAEIIAAQVPSVFGPRKILLQPVVERIAVFPPHALLIPVAVVILRKYAGTHREKPDSY